MRRQRCIGEGAPFLFPSGDLLVSGLRYDRDKNNHVMWPFTGIFSSDGTLLKEVTLEDDDDIRNLAASGDARVSSTTNPYGNHAVEFGQSEAADDGNIYLIRMDNLRLSTPSHREGKSSGGL
jgi:hypothetical protein